MKMLIFLSPNNPMWHQLFDKAVYDEGPPFRGHWKRLSELTAKATNEVNLSHWRRGANISTSLSDRILSSIESHARATTPSPRSNSFLSKLNQFSENYRDDSQHIYDAAIAIGMKAKTAQKIIDDVIYSRHPIFPGLYFREEDQADLALKLRLYCGTYTVWIWHGESLMQGSMRVRYELKIGDGRVIRCKLNLPSTLTHKRHALEYDGFLAVRQRQKHHHLYWLFEGRMDRPDYLTCITSELRRHRGTMMMHGTYLAPNYSSIQETQGHSLATTGKILAQREVKYDADEENDFEAIRDFMTNSPTDLSDDTDLRETLDLRWAELQKSFLDSLQ